MPKSSYAKILKDKTFSSLLITQFLGAFNDNLCRMIIIFTALSQAEKLGQSSTTLIPLIGGVFIIPYLFFSGYAGYLADKYSKTTVLIRTKFLEIISMGLMLFTLISGNVYLMIAVLFIMSTQSTFFSPAKYGILPELFSEGALARANGLINMTTFVSIILGTALGGYMFFIFQDAPYKMGVVLLIIAIIGFISALLINKVPPSGSKVEFKINPYGEIFEGIKILKRNKTLFLSCLSVAYFWFIGSLVQLDIPIIATELMMLKADKASLLIAALAVGVGLGSLMAGRLSVTTIEIGIVPIGAMGVTAFLITSGLVSGAPLASDSFNSMAIHLSLLGFFGGLYVVPLIALVQERSPVKEKGRVLATLNVLSTIAMLLSVLSIYVLGTILKVSTADILLIFGGVTVFVTIYILTVVPDFAVRFVLLLFTHSIYKINLRGVDNIPKTGPALIVCNHMSHVDGLLIGANVPRFVRFMLFKPYYEMRGLHWFFKMMKMIPVSNLSKSDTLEAIDKARESLKNGELVCIFAEGAISRTGNMLPFKRGYEKILDGLDVPIIPAHLDRLWGSIFSFKEGKFFFKWPKKIPYPVTVSFGKPLKPHEDPFIVRKKVQELGTTAFEDRRKKGDTIGAKFIKTAKGNMTKDAVIDSTDKHLSYFKLLTLSLILSSKFKSLKANKSNTKMVGLILPPLAVGAAVNIACYFRGLIPVNLNFTAGSDFLRFAVNTCELKEIITSKSFIKKAGIERTPEMIFIEDIVKNISSILKISSMLKALAPRFLIKNVFTKTVTDPYELSTILFSSGSTATPKAIKLSHHNIISNIDGIDQVLWLTNKDKIMGVLPFFHSFGFTGALWLPLLSGFAAVYHPNPLDPKTIGEMIKKYKATLFITTPTFAQSYIRKCEKEDLESLRFAITGAEKLKLDTFNKFKEKFDIELQEGYGATEMGPVISLNIPDFKAKGSHQKGTKFGTVGHPIPGVTIKIVNIDDLSKTLTYEEEGLLMVKGPGMMTGYLKDDVKTNEAIVDGWYNTGDIARIDKDGFITITDRLARFSKIAGEMVPHEKVEGEIKLLLHKDADCAVTSVYDDKKGEALVVLHTDENINIDDITTKLNQSEMPNLWVPKKSNYFFVPEIPVLGTGKKDLKTIKSMAHMFLKIKA